MKEMGSRFDVMSQLASLRRYARSLARDPEEAEDLVHDALVKAYEKRDSFHGERNLRRWLFSIVHNRFVDLKRSAKRREANIVHLAETATDQNDPAQEHAARLAQLREHFMMLPEDQRAALHLVAVEGLSYGDAAAALGIPIGTLMSRISRARAALRALENGDPTLIEPGPGPDTGDGAKIYRIGRRTE